MRVVEKLSKEFISADLNQIVNDSIMYNQVIKGLFLKGESTSEEVYKISKSIQEMKKRDKANDEGMGRENTEEIQKSKENSQKGVSNQNLVEIKLKISELENILIDLKIQFDRNLKGSSEEEEDEKSKEVSSNNLRDYIKNVYLSVRAVTERVS
jgi:hypothetical protein